MLVRLAQRFAVAVGRCVGQQRLAQCVPHALRLGAIFQAVVLAGHVQQVLGVVGIFGRHNGHAVADALRPNDGPVDR